MKRIDVVYAMLVHYIIFYENRVNFINGNEILKAHRQHEANQEPQMGLFCTC